MPNTLPPLPIDPVFNPPPTFDGALKSVDSVIADIDGQVRFFQVRESFRLGQRSVTIESLIVRESYDAEDPAWGLVALRCQATRSACSYVLNQDLLRYLDSELSEADSRFG